MAATGSEVARPFARSPAGEGALAVLGFAGQRRRMTVPIPARRPFHRRVYRWWRRRWRSAAPIVRPPHTATPVGDNRVLVGTQVGDRHIVYYVEADDRLLSPWFITTGQYETELTDFLLGVVRPGSHCLDIGCNFGFFTCLFGRHADEGRVIAVEADAKVAALARDNVAANGLWDRVEVVHAAASADRTDVTLFRRVSRSGNTSVVDVGAGGAALLGEPPPERFSVPGVTIDSLGERLGGRVDLIKIDVEGFEPQVLAGATATIRANPQLIIAMEWSPGQVAAAGVDPADFAARIDAMGLSAATLSGRPLRPAELAVLPYQAAVVLRVGR